MKAQRKVYFVFCACFLILFSLTACSTPTPVVETVEVTRIVQATTVVEVEVTRVVEVTRRVEVDVVVTATPTPETPTPTPEPTATVQPTPVPLVDYTTEEVSFTTEDGYELFGNLFLSAEGDTAVVFAHMAGENDQQNWVPFANQVARRGFTALTFNFRCYGQSECGGKESGDILLSYDLSAAMDFLRGYGYERFVCIGASMGGRACINVAFDEELVGLVIVSGSGAGSPERQNLNDFLTPDMPKLFIVAENDPTANRVVAMTNLYESAPEPKEFKVFSGSGHGTELFDTKHGQALRQLIYEFLEGLRLPSDGG